MRWSAMLKGTPEEHQQLQPPPSTPTAQQQQQQQQPFLSHGSRRWPFIAVLLSVVLLGSSPWLYSQLMPTVYNYQRTGSHLQSTPSEMMYNPFGDNFTFERAVEILNCTNRGWSGPPTAAVPPMDTSTSEKECPLYFQLIEKDLAPWKEKGVSRVNVEMARELAAFRVIIFDSKLYIDRRTACFANRARFTVWGLLLFLEKYKGQVPDLEMMFNCEDRPRVPKGAGPGPEGPVFLFGYNTNSDYYDIAFPDWSFWGWSELMISSWDEKRETIANGSRQMDWTKKVPTAFWSGNPFVGAPHRVELLKCNKQKKTEIESQDWRKELAVNKQNSKLEDKCLHRYMIYTEGNGWSVSLKYIFACGSPTLVIAPSLYDFFSRGLQEWVHYIPVYPKVLRAPELCEALDQAVEFGEANETRAMEIGKAGQHFMRDDIGMENVYNYMFHLLKEYAKLQRFKPTIPGAGHLVTLDQVQCLVETHDRLFLQQAMKVMPTNPVPCTISETGVDFEGYGWQYKWPK